MTCLECNLPFEGMPRALAIAGSHEVRTPICRVCYERVLGPAARAIGNRAMDRAMAAPPPSPASSDPAAAPMLAQVLEVGKGWSGSFTRKDGSMIAAVTVACGVSPVHMSVAVEGREIVIRVRQDP